MDQKRTHGPLDQDFAAGYVPLDCPFEQAEYRRWKEAGGVSQPPLALVPLGCPEGSFGVRVEG